MEIVNNPHADNLVRYGASRPGVVVLSGDLTVATECHKFRDAHPDRFFSMGMAEQNMLSWAGGMAREGMIPFVHSFCVFLYRRPYDQLQMSVAYPNLPVHLVGFLPETGDPDAGAEAGRIHLRSHRDRHGPEGPGGEERRNADPAADVRVRGAQAHPASPAPGRPLEEGIQIERAEEGGAGPRPPEGGEPAPGLPAQAVDGDVQAA